MLLDALQKRGLHYSFKAEKKVEEIIMSCKSRDVTQVSPDRKARRAQKEVELPNGWPQQVTSFVCASGAAGAAERREQRAKQCANILFS
jgi:hypothetical protein